MQKYAKLEMIDNKEKIKKAKCAFKLGLFEHEEVTVFAEDKCKLLSQATYRSFHFFEDESGNLLMVKALSEDNNDAYSYDVYHLESLTDEEFIKISKYRRQTSCTLECFLKYFTVFLILVVFISGLCFYFDSLDNISNLSNFASLTISVFSEFILGSFILYLLFRKK